MQLSVNGRDIPVRAARIAGQVAVLADWDASGPGSYRIVLDKAGELQEATVTIESAKLGQAGLSALLEDLTLRLPTSIAVGIQRGGGLVGINLQPPGETTLAQDLLRLRRAIERVSLRPWLGAHPPGHRDRSSPEPRDYGALGSARTGAARAGGWHRTHAHAAGQSGPRRAPRARDR